MLRVMYLLLASSASSASSLSRARFRRAGLAGLRLGVAVGESEELDSAYLGVAAVD